MTIMHGHVTLVVKDNNVYGPMSRVDSHLVSNDLPLHRAFLLFLFDDPGRILFRKRAATKVTFPSY